MAVLILRAPTAPPVFNFYISTTGTGTAAGGGTLIDPWSISMLNDSTARSRYAGHTVGLIDGTYGLISLMGQPVESSGQSQRARLHIAGGSSGNPTIIKAVTPQQAIIDFQRGSMTNNSMESSMDAVSQYVTIDGLVFDNNNYHAIVNDPGGGSGVDNLIIQNCIFRNQSFSRVPSQGQNCAYIFSQDGDNVLISNCRFTGGNASGDLNRHNCIHFFTPTVNCTVEYCTFISEALGTDIIHCKNQGAKNLIVRRCYIDRSAVTQTSQSGYAIKFEGVNDATDVVTIENNIIITGGTTSRSAFSANPGTAGTYNINNNTLVGPWDTDGGVAGVYSRQPVQFNFSNNIIKRASGTGGTYGDVNVYSVATTGSMDRNFYTSSLKIIVGDVVSSYTSIGAWQGASSKDTNSQVGADPLFMGSGTDADIYKTQSGSPCKTMSSGGGEIGAWANQTRIGSSI